MTTQDVKIDVEDFVQHHDECLAISEELFKIIECTQEFSPPKNRTLYELANRLDKSITKLQIRFP